MNCSEKQNEIINSYSLTIVAVETVGLCVEAGVRTSDGPRIFLVTMTLAFLGIRSELSLYSKMNKR